MTIEEFITIYQRCMELRAQGQNDQAETLLKQGLGQLSSEQRETLMTEIATMTLEDEVRERDIVTSMQEKTIAAYNDLDKVKNEVENDNG